MPPEDLGTATAAAPIAPAADAAGAAPAAPPDAGSAGTIDAARERLARTGSLLPEETAASEADATGTETATPASGAETEAAAPAGEAAAGPLEITLTSGEGEESQSLTFTAPNQEVFDALTQALAPEEDHDDLVVTYPGLAERGEPDITVELPDAEALERHRRLVNEAELGRQIKQERRALDRKADAVEAFDDAITQDPVGVVMDRLKPEIQEQIVWNALLTPGVLDGITARLAREEVAGGLAELAENPTLLRALRGEAQHERDTQRDRARAMTAERRSARVAAQRVTEQVESLVPGHLAGDARDRAYEGALAYVSENLGTLPATAVKPAIVAAFVHEYLQAQGITVEPVPSGSGNGKSAAATPPAAPARTGTQFTQAAAARRSAAVAAPAGAGALVSKARPALPETTKDRIAYLRQHGLKVLGG